MTESAIVLLFLLTCIRPAIGILLAVPVIPAHAVVLWTASMNGTPALAVAIFAGMPTLLLMTIAGLTVFRTVVVPAGEHRVGSSQVTPDR